MEDQSHLYMSQCVDRQERGYLPDCLCTEVAGRPTSNCTSSNPAVEPRICSGNQPLTASSVQDHYFAHISRLSAGVRAESCLDTLHSNRAHIIGPACE